MKKNVINQMQFFKLCNAVKNDMSHIRVEGLTLDQMELRYKKIVPWPISKGVFRRVFKAIEKPIPAGSQGTANHAKNSPMSIVFERVDKVHKAIFKMTDTYGMNADEIAEIQDILDWEPKEK